MKKEKLTTNDVASNEKVEEVKDNISNENITPIDMNSVNIYEINKDIDVSNFESDVETKRANLMATYKKQKKMSNIMTLIMVALVIASMVMITQKLDAVKYAGYAVGGVALVGMLVFWGVNRNKMPNLMTNYMKEVSDIFNAYLYKDAKFVKPSANSEERMETVEIAGDKVYANIKGIGSRNVVHGTFLEKPFTVADVKAVTLSGKNKEEDLFVGKYLTCQNGLKFDGRVILNIRVKGAKVYDIPNDIADLNQVESKDQLTIWATPGLDYKKVLTHDIINKLNRLEVNEDKHLYNMNIVIWGGHTAVYLSYDNAVMSFPFEDEFKKSGLEHFKNDQDIIFDVFEMMMKTKSIKTSKVVKQEEIASEETTSTESKPEEVKPEEVKSEEVKVEDASENKVVEAEVKEEVKND